VGRVEAIGMVELLIDSVEEIAYTFLFCCLVVDAIFFLFFEEDECLPLCKPLPLESAKTLVAFLA